MKIFQKMTIIFSILKGDLKLIQIDIQVKNDLFSL